MDNKFRLYTGTLASAIFLGYLFWSGYDNVTLGREKCEKMCLAQGAVKFVWVPETKQRWSQHESSILESEAKCTCYTQDEIEQNKKSFESMKQTIREFKQINK